ncbi:1-hydroxy-2-methyl-2-butenyl 4-diphosphate reductase [Yinghuangia sp. ASG 101]|uniref:phosphorylase family protein n=1 Tax=Yinghuangia sp. ASG 101 TaxID=2896848 RepID=UPI001E2EDA67|nr:1-hydroxy-2-methyl-2-butenyl 4-diphosphate reductase [Yinghuangia sp. ASG 101]UGQ13684.1 1-hydroxy-2-methyl-2-butenyl 4-diphosphate reductase [Yinghuangia sp. ASG 101]
MTPTEPTIRPGRAAAPRPLLLAPLGIERRALLRGGAPDVARSGMGEAKSRAFAAALTGGPAAEPIGAVVVAGMGAGMLGLLPGDVVVASEVRDPDGAVFACPWADTLAASLTEALRGAPPRVHTGPVATVRKLVRTAERGALARTGVVAADMESAFLLAGLGMRGGERPDLPWAVVRVVSDAPGHELMRPGIVRNGLRAYRSLKASAPALSGWLGGVSSGRRADSVPLPPGGGAGEADLGPTGGPAGGAAKEEQDGGAR